MNRSVDEDTFWGVTKNQKIIPTWSHEVYCPQHSLSRWRPLPPSCPKHTPVLAGGTPSPPFFFYRPNWEYPNPLATGLTGGDPTPQEKARDQGVTPPHLARRHKPVKTLPSIRTTCAGGKCHKSLWLLGLFVISSKFWKFQLLIEKSLPRIPVARIFIWNKSHSTAWQRH